MRRGFTLTHLIAVIVAAVVLLAVIVVYASDQIAQIRQFQDAAHLRGIGQAMWIWADGNDGSYPLPSAIDNDNATVSELGRAKDTTGNILSVLISNWHATPELCVSRLEKNNKISAYTDYEDESPRSAVDPANALWDPGFSADFTSDSGGHTSYAHLIPVGDRLDMWSNTGKGDEAVLANRGPEIASVERSDGNILTRFVDPKSRSMRIHRSRRGSWSGNVYYNDGATAFQKNLYTNNKAAGTSSYHRLLAGTEDHDVLFADEEGFGSNLFLGIFTSAGETKDQYTPIWD